MTEKTKSVPDPRVVYADIIDRPHWQSPTRPHMSLYDRSAQFAAYKALTGYEDMVAEEARLTDSKIELGEDGLEILNQKLSLIADVTEDGEHPVVTVTYFVPDETKSGGRYERVTDAVKKLDLAAQQLVLMSKAGIAGRNTAIDIGNILTIHGDLVDYMDSAAV